MEMQNTSQAAGIEAAPKPGVFALVGEYDLFASDALECEIESRLRDVEALTLDFSACTYIDSSILTVLVRAVRAYGDKLEMVVTSDGSVARILTVTQLDKYFPIVS